MSAIDRWEANNTADFRTFFATDTGRLVHEILSEFAAEQAMCAIRQERVDRDYRCGVARGCEQMLESLSNLAEPGKSPVPNSQLAPEGVTSAEQLYAP